MDDLIVHSELLWATCVSLWRACGNATYLIGLFLQQILTLRLTIKKQFDLADSVMSDMQSFLTPEPVLYHTHSKGFVLFGAGHLLSLAISAAIITCSLMLYLRLPKMEGGFSKQRLAMIRVLAGGAVAIILGKCAWYLAIDMFEPLFWPLHVCNLCEFVALGYALSPQSRTGGRLADLLFCWGLTGCPSALLLPGWAWYCPAWTLVSLCGFVEHALVFACALCVLAGGEYQPHPQRIWFVAASTLACGFAARVINPLLGTNFFFVTNPMGAGWPFSWLASAFGDPGFLAPYFALTVLFWGAVYALYLLIRRH